MSKAENYLAWQFGTVSPHVRGAVLEVGGGIGNFTLQLAQFADHVTTLEPNDYCVRQLREKVAGNPGVTVLQTTVEDLDSSLKGTFSTIVLMNVLEHIENDVQVIRQLDHLLIPGGEILVLVPAMQFAFGETDRRLGHYRRYTARSVRRLAADVGMQLTRRRYFNFVGLWGWLWNAKVTRRANQSEHQIRFFDRFVVPVMSRLERLIPPPIGQSIFFSLRNTLTTDKS